MNSSGPPLHRLAGDWSQWAPNGARPWSVQIAEDVMVVDPDGGALAALPPFGDSVVSLTTAPRATVAEAVVEIAFLRSGLARTLRTEHGLTAAAAGLHPWSEASGPLDPACGVSIAVTVPDAESAVRALNGVRVHLPLLLALAANSPFWRGRDTGLASTRTALRASGAPPRSFASYGEYVAVLEVLLRAGAIPSAAAVAWDARLRPERGAVEVLVMDSQTRASELAALAALVACLVRIHAEPQQDRVTIPELLLENRAAAIQKGMRADLIDPAGQFVQPAGDELALVVEGCAPVARGLGCSRELAAAVQRNACDSGHVRQRNIAASAGQAALMNELVQDFATVPVGALTT